MAFTRTRVESLSGSLDFRASPCGLHLEEARGVIFLEEINALLQQSPSLKRAFARNRLQGGSLTLRKAFYQGPLSLEGIKKGLVFEAEANGLEIVTAVLPADLKILKGLLRYEKGGLSFGPAEVLILDAKGHISGKISPLLAQKPALTLRGRAEIGPQFLSWIYKKAGLPRELYPVPPLKVSHLEFSLDSNLRLKGSFRTGKGAFVKLNLSKSGDVLRLSSAKVSVGKRALDLRLSLFPNRASFSCRGELSKEDWFLLFERPWIAPKKLKARLRGTYYYRNLTRSEMRGDLALAGLETTWRGLPLIIQSLEAQGRGSRITFSHLKGRFDHFFFQAGGEWEFAPKNIRITGSVQIPYLDLDDLLSKLASLKSPKHSTTWPPLFLKLDTTMQIIVWRGFRLEELQGTLSYFEKHWQVTIEKGGFCGIHLAGKIDWSPEKKLLRLSYYQKKGDLREFLICSLGRKHLAEGAFSMEGTFQGQGEDSFLENTSGKFSFSSPQGRIYKLGVLVKLFAFLNPLEIFSGNLPDLSKEGFAYDRLEIKGYFEKHYLVVDTAQIKGQGLRIFTSGKIDRRKNNIQLTALISPFRQLDVVVSHIPIVGWVLTGKSKTFFAIPVEVRGSLKDPTIIPLDPRAVSKRILGILGRTLQLPVKLFIPGEGNPAQTSPRPTEKAPPNGK